jgi:putative tryptophan/tyrosine transport system substrate-binding protein
MTTRRKLLVALGTGALAAAFSSLAQQQAKVWRIGYLSPRAGIKSAEEAFLQGLRSLGYVDGQNIVIEWRFANGNADRLLELAVELVRLNVDCILAGGANSALAAKRATSTIPIVMGNTDDDPVRLGLVASLARPGGNVTGFINMGAQLAGKRLELLKETLPKVSRVGLLWDPNSRPAAGHMRETESTAHALGVTLQSLEVRKPDDLEHAFLVAGEMRAEALIVVATGSVNVHPARVVNLALKARLPAIYTTSTFVLDGGLMSYAEEANVTWRDAASYVDRILKGARPADLPVVQPTKFELLINLKTAKQIGLTIPESVLQRADRVIE